MPRDFSQEGWVNPNKYKHNSSNQFSDRPAYAKGGAVTSREHHMMGNLTGKRKKRELTPPPSPEYNSDSSVALSIDPMTQDPYENACWAATSGMAHNYHAKQGKLDSSNRLKDVKAVAKKANAGYQTRSGQSSTPYGLEQPADAAQVLTDIGLEPEFFAPGVRMPPLKGKESLKEKLSDRTPVITAVSKTKSVARKDPYTDPDAHYLMVSGVHPRRNSITINDPAYNGGASQETGLSPGGTSFKSGPTEYHSAVPVLAYLPNTPYGSSPVSSSSQSGITTQSGRVILKPQKYKP